MSGENSPGPAGEVPERAIRDEDTLGEKIEALPKTFMFFAFSFAILLSSVVMDATGFKVLAGVIGATAVIFMALAVTTHIGYFLLGKVD